MINTAILDIKLTPMKNFALVLALIFTTNLIAQNHSEKPIRFIFESIHDHLGNLDINSKRVQLFNTDHQLIYEADLYDGKELDEQFFYYTASGDLLRDHRIFHQEHESGDYRMTYDDLGNLIAETNYNDLGQIIESITMTYDSKGNMLSQIFQELHTYENVLIVESSFVFTLSKSFSITFF